MFTGIIENVGEIVALKLEGSNKRIKIASHISNELKVDQSLSHNGVCLTVVEVGQGVHEVVAVAETLKKSNLSSVQVGERVNLERSMLANGRFDGHLVQGHVDLTGHIEKITNQNGSWQFDFVFDANSQYIVVEKGSIAVNGVSLTCFNCSRGKFSVAVIPYTFEHTNFNLLKEQQMVNLEFDIVGKYIQQMLHSKN